MTSPLSAPTRLRGVVDDTAYDAVLHDILEHIPDLQPGLHAIQVYAQMRRDARLAAIEAGWALQLRRAQWQLDPAGCRQEVVDLVADDLGLMVAGRDRPGPARVRGVSWHEHLRAALLMLPYGHMAFEQLAEIRGGRARLVALADRMPHTIDHIEVDSATGALKGITQDVLTPGRDAPQIPADRLVFYAHEREGAGWHGRSLFRPAWAAWLLKRELMRIHSTSARRFGMGVPIVRALPGTNPTPAQHAAAADMAQQARVGDQSGAALPPGFVMELVGLSGGTVDVLAYLKWLNSEIATSTLMQHLDLGNTESGSRALGTAFIDNLMMALGALGEAVADVATRQVAARLVGWNWGEDEPVPRVVVSGIGSRREVTAESLKLLLDSGGLSADPGLEEWVRREYRLPERAAAPPVAPSTPTVAASAARKRAPRRRKEASGQLALPVWAQARTREPTELEEQAGTDFDGIAEDLEQAQQELAEQWPGLSEAMVAALVAAVVAAVAAGALDDLGDLAVPDEALAGIVSAVGDAMVALAAVSAGRAADELRGQGADVEVGEADEDRLRDAAHAYAGVIASGYASGAGRVALHHAGPDTDPDVVGAAVREHLDSLSTPAGTPGGWVATNLGGALHQALHAGRVATFDGDRPAPAG